MSMADLWPLLTAIAIVMMIVPTIGLYMTFVERKVAALVQDRLGPNRVGPLGLFQAIADAIKIMLKEQVTPAQAQKVLFMTAPGIGLVASLMAIAVVPFGPVPTDQPAGVFRFMIAPGVDIGLLFLLAVSSLSAYGIILGGWASNNKYSMYGAIRSCAQFISYEVPLGLSILGIVAYSGTLSIEGIVASQSAGILHWNIWWQPLAAIIFFTSALAETNRLPFDLPECEQELVGGFHTEYSGIKFVLFFLAEYTHVVTVSFLVALLFLGGWHFPGVPSPAVGLTGSAILSMLILVIKVMMVVFFILMLRWTLPRFRFDQLMGLAWKGLIPLAMANLLGVVIVLSLGGSRWIMLPVSIALFVAGGYASALSFERAGRPVPPRPSTHLIKQGVA
ncbi:NADH-quinone oxidoreductase subunit NuoH [bacterium]|jgi:NADH-quinone oxidoreductase subunit H|nr:NADH-quinone oxidoreductase subunit NuoH [bacterium]